MMRLARPMLSRISTVKTSRVIHWETVNAELFPATAEISLYPSEGKPQNNRYGSDHRSAHCCGLSSIFIGARDLSELIQQGLTGHSGSHRNAWPPRPTPALPSCHAVVKAPKPLALKYPQNLHTLIWRPYQKEEVGARAFSEGCGESNRGDHKHHLQVGAQ